MRKKHSDRGRPKAQIDFRKVDQYLQAQCSGASIAGILGVHPDTLYQAVEERYKTTFSAYSQEKRAEGKDVLRMKLWNLAMKGNTAVAIWLSKNYLGMTDKQELDVSTNLSTLSNEQLICITNEIIRKQNEHRNG